MQSNPYIESEKFVRAQIDNHSGLELFRQGESIVSFHPAEFLWGYTYHSHCIPPFKPESVLILGYGKGQIAHLIRKIYGSDIKVTGVDLVPQDYKYMEYQIKICDAKDYVKACSHSIIKKRFDYIVVDLFDGEKVPDFVFGGEFAVSLKAMTKKILCINSLASDFDRLANYHNYGFLFHRFIPIFNNNVSFWGV